LVHQFTIQVFYVFGHGLSGTCSECNSDGNGDGDGGLCVQGQVEVMTLLTHADVMSQKKVLNCSIYELLSLVT
jgi:hypothetical protein